MLIEWLLFIHNYSAEGSGGAFHESNPTSRASIVFKSIKAGIDGGGVNFECTSIHSCDELQLVVV